MTISVHNRQRDQRLPAGQVRAAVLAALQTTSLVRRWLREGIDPYVEVSLVGRQTMRRLNREHRDVDRVTDVLSFPQLYLRSGRRSREGDEILLPTDDGWQLFLGDLVLCPAVAAEEADRRMEPFLRETQRLLAHGTLHLLGYDHDTPARRRTMERLTNEALASLEAGS